MKAVLEKLCLLAAVVLLSSCGGGESDSDFRSQALAVPAKCCVPNKSCFSLGGTIRGMTKIRLVLANGTDRISLPASATTVVFPTYIARGAAYAVSVTAQPAGQQCTVANGIGMGDDKISFDA